MPDRLAEYMVNLIPDDSIRSVVDLSMGECGLLEEAKKRWENAVLYGADIDETLIKKIHKKCPYIHTYSGDSLSGAIEKWDRYHMIANGEGFDLAIANPPFNFYDQEEQRLNKEKVSLPIEMRFLLKYINIVKNDGFICIILPYGFLSLDLYEKFRTKVLEKVTILKIIKIFNHCFDKIDADTCLVLMKKDRGHKQGIQEKITIAYLSDNYKLLDRQVALTSRVKRWDLEYQRLLSHDFIYCAEFEKTILNSYIKSCRRGKSIAKNKHLLSEKGSRFIHTTDVKKLYISNEHKQYISGFGKYFEKSVLQKDDRLIGRVGQGRTDSNPALFVSLCRPHERLGRSGIEAILRRLGHSAGVDNVHPHRYRRTALTNAANRGMPLQDVQSLAGHASPNTTMIYCTVDRSKVKTEHKRCIWLHSSETHMNFFHLA